MNEAVEAIYQWHKGMKIQQISQSLGLDRKTVRKYLGMVRCLGITRGGPLPDEQELAMRLKEVREHLFYERPAFDVLAPHRGQIEAWLADTNTTGKQVWRLLKEVFGIEVGYTTLRRYLRSEFSYGRTRTTVRIETPPGEEAQVDFGYAGLMHDPETERNRRTWAFIMTLSYSRHKFVRFVFRQDIAMWLDCHERAFAFFGGVPRRIILDNLKSGVLKPDIYDPTINRAYADMERFYGFVADRRRWAWHSIRARWNGLFRLYAHTSLQGGRSEIAAMPTNEPSIGQGGDRHGDPRNDEEETVPCLPRRGEGSSDSVAGNPLRASPLEECTVHPDHHIVFDKSYYSLPTRYIGRKVW